jgi:uncharacterized lipoprotein YddW (UPF0748 family)
VIPQIYWHRGFNLADYETLARWWNDNSYDVQVYIGQGLYRVDKRILYGSLAQSEGNT